MGTMPHCDSRVLHAPGECRYCDDYPEWQRAREMWRIAFTGHTPAAGHLPCPSETQRSADSINRWPGNQPKPPTTLGATVGNLIRDGFTTDSGGNNG